jgi:hypothetical protein
MSKREIAENFLMLASKGESHKAFKLFVAYDFIHHNAYFKGDRLTLTHIMH